MADIFRLPFTLIATTLFWTSPQQVFAQDQPEAPTVLFGNDFAKDLTTEDFLGRLDLSVPESPLFSLMGSTPENVIRPQTADKFAIAVLPQTVDALNNQAFSFALEINPGQFFLPESFNILQTKAVREELLGKLGASRVTAMEKSNAAVTDALETARRLERLNLSVAVSRQIDPVSRWQLGFGVSYVWDKGAPVNRGIAYTACMAKHSTALDKESRSYAKALTEFKRSQFLSDAKANLSALTVRLETYQIDPSYTQKVLVKIVRAYNSSVTGFPKSSRSSLTVEGAKFKPIVFEKKFTDQKTGVEQTKMRAITGADIDTVSSFTAALFTSANSINGAAAIAFKEGKQQPVRQAIETLLSFLPEAIAEALPSGRNEAKLAQAEYLKADAAYTAHKKDCEAPLDAWNRNIYGIGAAVHHRRGMTDLGTESMRDDIPSIAFTMPGERVRETGYGLWASAAVSSMGSLKLNNGQLAVHARYVDDLNRTREMSEEMVEETVDLFKVGGRYTHQVHTAKNEEKDYAVRLFAEAAYSEEKFGGINDNFWQVGGGLEFDITKDISFAFVLGDTIGSEIDRSTYFTGNLKWAFLK